MAVRTVPAVAVLAAAAAVFWLVRDRHLHREFARERAADRLTAGCLHRDLHAFRVRLEAAVAQVPPPERAGLAPEEVLSTHDPIAPPMEGGPR